ncbi:LAMI_0D03752g1_1 [Lachancea mirantina]|uniref:LAMI_0D03752g1_1 n=1 Tax=Lachancea mirantina TaxID=1230905 RepID=A0A1G4J9Y9_9SACH|nr:LAMI_0D03752g1_1 [Lachancea mirantina]
MVFIDVDLCLFDLDGTLVSTTTAAESAWKVLCAKHHVDPQELFKHSHGSRTAEIIERFFPNIDSKDPNVIMELELSIGKDYLDTVKLIAGAKELLLSLNQGSTENPANTDNRPWAIVTSGSPYLAFSWFDNILKEVGKPSIFITAFDVKHGKPDPEGYTEARNQLSAVLNLDSRKARAVVFEDAPVGIEAGNKIGAITVGLTSSYPKERLFEAGADYVVEDLTHVKVIEKSPRGIKLEISKPLSR